MAGFLFVGIEPAGRVHRPTDRATLTVGNQGLLGSDRARTDALPHCFNAFSLREPASTPLKNAPEARSMILQSLAGLPAFLVYFCTALVAVVAFLFVYTRVTPHDEFQLIRDNDPAAAIALGLRLLGFVLPLVSAIAHSANVVDCLIWSAIALVVQIGVYFIVKIPRTKPTGSGGAVGATSQRRMSTAWSFIQWRSRLFGRIVAQQFLRRRHLVGPFFVRHRVRFRFGRRHARRLRRICACVHVAFFRRRLTTRPTDDVPHDAVKRFALACRSIATLPQCESLNIRA
jgi:putative membrane protein